MKYAELKKLLDEYEFARYPGHWIMGVPEFAPSIRRFYDFLARQDKKNLLAASAYYELLMILNSIEHDFVALGPERQLVQAVRHNKYFESYEQCFGSDSGPVLSSSLAALSMPINFNLAPLLEGVVIKALEHFTATVKDFTAAVEDIDAQALNNITAHVAFNFFDFERMEDQRKIGLMLWELAKDPGEWDYCNRVLVEMRKKMTLNLDELFRNYFRAKRASVVMPRELVLLFALPGFAAKQMLMQTFDIKISKENVEAYCDWLEQLDMPEAYFTLGLILSNELLFNADYLLNEYHLAIEAFARIPSSYPFYTEAQDFIAHLSLLAGSYQQVLPSLHSPVAASLYTTALTLGGSLGLLPSTLPDQTPVDPYHAWAIVPYEPRV